MSPSIYNATDGPLAIDRAGRMIAAGERRDDLDNVDGSPLAGHVKAERIIVVDGAPAEEPVEDDAPGQLADPQPAAPKRTRKDRASTTTQEA